MVRFILLGGVLPGAIATIILLLAWWRYRTKPDSTGPRWVLPIVLVLSMLPAERLVQGKLPSLLHLPTSAGDRMPHVAVASCVAALLCAFRCVRTRVPAVLLLAAACAFSFWLVLSYRYPSFWNTSQKILWMSIFTTAGTMIGTVIERAASRHRGLEIPIVLFISANALPFVLRNSENAYLAQLAGGVAAACGAALVVAFLVPTFCAASGAPIVFTAVLGALVLLGHYLAPGKTPLLQLLLVAITPLSTALVFVNRFAALKKWKRCLLIAFAASIPAAVAVALSFAFQTPESSADIESEHSQASPSFPPTSV